jgi:hypothetical protein
LRIGNSIAVYIADQLGRTTKITCGISCTAQQQKMFRLVRICSASSENTEIVVFLNIMLKKIPIKIYWLVSWPLLLTYNKAISEDGDDGSITSFFFSIIAMFVAPLLKNSQFSQGACSNGKAERNFQLRQNPFSLPISNTQTQNNRRSWSLRRFVHPQSQNFTTPPRGGVLKHKIKDNGE